MLTQIYKFGGDPDTIGALAGAIWGAFNGVDAIDKIKAVSIENSTKIDDLSGQLHAMLFKKPVQWLATTGVDAKVRTGVVLDKLTNPDSLPVCYVKFAPTFLAGGC